MDIVIIIFATLIVSILTLFSGFGLGTLLMPVFSLFYPIEIAIAITAFVHFANNIFKLGLFIKKIDIGIIIRFGIPAIIASFLGAYTLILLGNLKPFFTYNLFEKSIVVYPLKFVIGLIIIAFVIIEILEDGKKFNFDRKWLALGGVLSGFFGGLSGHQGAFRSMFLIKSGLEKDVFVATGATLATMVDFSRLIIYGLNLSFIQNTNLISLIAITSTAFLGSYLGKKFLKKITIKSVKIVVSVFLLILAAGFISGLL